MKKLESTFVDSFGMPGDMPRLVRTAGLRVKGEWNPWTPGEREIKWTVGKR